MAVDTVEAIFADMRNQGGGTLTVVLDEAGDWAAAYVFGREADDSPMAGGASYGVGASPYEALRMIVDECRLEA